MSLHIPFENTYAALPDSFFARQKPTRVASPQLISFNHDLARSLGIHGTEDPDLAALFSGNTLPDGAQPIAQLYAGHQFGQFNPQLGDGRAILLGEVVGRDGLRRDVQLKGSGPTPFSRMGDGRAWLGPVLREYLISEAMFALGVPTTRALAAVRTGEEVIRERPLPGAVLTRVASSHIRVGTFQVFAARRQTDALQQLYDYTVARHAPDAKDPAEFLRIVIARQAALVAQWMALGFIHGVMNTDNCTISGETIDYGPCAFMDGYDPETVFSSIDRFGRYSYAAQADIIVWNMAQLATSLLALMLDTEASLNAMQEQINAMPDLIRAEWLKRFAAKIGIQTPLAEDATLIADLLTLMHQTGADFTNTFRHLAQHGTPMGDTAFSSWTTRWEDRIAQEPAPQSLMLQVNPAFIPRNHRVEQMITAAVAGDDAPFHRMLQVLSRPFADQPEAEDLRQPPKATEVVKATFCGT